MVVRRALDAVRHVVGLAVRGIVGLAGTGMGVARAIVTVTVTMLDPLRFGEPGRVRRAAGHHGRECAAHGKQHHEQQQEPDAHRFHVDKLIKAGRALGATGQASQAPPRARRRGTRRTLQEWPAPDRHARDSVTRAPPPAARPDLPQR
jgi:hypothetical protein